MILVSQTYETVTPESAEDGEAAERGYRWENVPHTFRELVALMREHGEPSDGRLQDDGITGTWFTTAEPAYDHAYYERGEETTTSIHYSRDNLARSAKYWAKAARLVYGNKYR